MTQPSSKIGPVTIGGGEVFGNSAQGTFETLAAIQRSAKGCGEWIDGLNTGTGPFPDFAHDHRGGVWGRPLGLGHSVPMRPVQTLFNTWEAETFVNVPDVSSPTGEAFPTTDDNGGYQLVDLYIYHAAGAGTKAFNLRISVWENGAWTTPARVGVSVVVAGPGAQWSQASAPVQLPAGLVRLQFDNSAGSGIAGWEWVSLVVPQR